MNKIYKVIWSKTRNCYVAVSEIAKRNGKNCTSVHRGGVVSRGLAARVLCTLLLGTYLVGGYSEPVAWGAPSGNGATIQARSGYVDATGTYASAWGVGDGDSHVTASGYGSTAFGMATTASGSYATAWGLATNASSLYATAWGNRTTASGNFATAFGLNSEAKAYGATAWGGYFDGGDHKGGTASGKASTAFGVGTTANTLGSTAWGNGTLAGSGSVTAGGVTYTGNGTYATAWGKATYAIGSSSTAFGDNTIASGSDSTAFGYLSTASGYLATAWGYKTKASGNYATAFGRETDATGQGATAWGRYSQARGENSTAFGWYSYALGYGSTSFGTVTNAEGDYATAFGNRSRARSTYATAWGYYTKAGKLVYGGQEVKIVQDGSEYKIVVDDGSTSGGATLKSGFTSYNEAYDDAGLTKVKYATAFGDSTVASGEAATAFGEYSKATGSGATAWGGYYNSGSDYAHGGTASGMAATAFGNNTTASGKGATAFGGGTTADGDYSVAWGTDSKVQTGAENSTAFGDGSTVGSNVENALAALGATVNTGANNSAAIGNGATASLADTVALGSGSVASRAKYDPLSNPYSAAFSTNATDPTTTAWRSTQNAIAVGDDATVTRQITGVAAGSEETDAVNVAQLTAAVASVGGDAGALHVYGTDVTRTGTDASAWGYKTKAEGNYATAWGYFTSAIGPSSTAWGFSTKAVSQSSTVWGRESQAGWITYKGDDAYVDSYDGGTKYGIFKFGSGNLLKGNFSTIDEVYSELEANGTVTQYATAFGYRGYAFGDFSTAFGYNTYARGSGATAWGVATEANGSGATAWGGYRNSDSDYATGGVASGPASTAWGVSDADNDKYVEASGKGATAFGYISTASGEYATAFGNASQANADNSLAVLGGTTAAAATNSAAIGKGATASLADTVALGSGSVANRAKYATTSYTAAFSENASDATTTAWRSTNNAIAVGDGSTVTRQITGVAAGSEETDAVNVAQLAAAVAGAGGGAVYSAGDGIDISGLNKISVKADTGDFTFDSGTLKIKKDGDIASGNTGIVTGGTVFTETRVSADGNYIQKSNSAAANLIALDTAMGTKANVDLDNLTAAGIAKGKEIAQAAVKLENGTHTTVSSYVTTEGNKFYKVNVDDTGSVANGNTGLVTGGTVYSALSSYKTVADSTYAKLDASNLADANVTAWRTKLGGGTVTSGNTGLVTGGTVFTETRVTADGNYVLKTNSAAENLTALDTAVKNNADAIAGKADAATTLAGYGITDAAMSDASNLTDANKASWGAALGTGSVTSGNGGLVKGGAVYDAIETAKVAVNDATNTKLGAYTKLDGTNLTGIDSANWGNALGTGAVDSGNGELVTGDTVYAAIETAIDPLQTKTQNISATSGATTITGTLNAGATTVSSLTSTGTISGTDITASGALSGATLVVDGNDVTTALTTPGAVASGNGGYVTGGTVYDALSGKADASSVYTKTETDNAFAKKDSVYTKTETDNAFAKKDSVYTKNEMDSMLDAKADQTALDAVDAKADAAKTTADQAKTAVDSLGDISDLRGGEVAEGSNKNVTGAKVYDYLNDSDLKLGANSTTIAIGQGSTATGTQSISIGFGNNVSGNNSGAFGDPNTVSGTDSYAFGNNNNISGNNSFVLGNNATVTGSRSVALGEGSQAFEDNVVSVGAPDNERRITNVAPGTAATDAATFGQVNSVAQSVNRVDSKINKVGAGAAALAALHPIDTDDKFSMGLGYGNYRDAHAGASGLFYRPTEKIMMSVGGSLGNGENMINAGISFALDKGKGFGTSKAAMARKIAALTEENAAQAAKIESLEARLAAIEAKLAK